MKNASVALQNFLTSSQQFKVADLYTFTQAGVDYRYASADGDVTLPGNLLTYSDQPDNAAWTKEFVTVSANAAAAPDGSITADAIVEDGSTNGHRISQIGTVPTAPGFFTMSVCMKAGSRTWAQLIIQETASSTYCEAYFNLSTGALGVTNTGANFSSLNASSVSLGGGWYRLYLTANKTNSAVGIRCYAAPAISNGTNTWTGTGAIAVYLVGLGLMSLRAPYIPEQTTGAAIPSRTFDASTIIIKRGKTKTVIGLQTDTLDLNIAAASTHTIGGGPFLQAVRQGFFDGAQLRFERLIMATYGDYSLGTVIGFTGRVGDVKSGRLRAQMRINSDLELLDVQLPRNVFQPGCINTLFDSGCTLSKAAFGTNNAATVGSTVRVINCTLAQAAGYFSQGTIKFTSGALNGVTATISSYLPGQITLIGPLLAAPVAGDTFTAYAGCDKQQATCSGKFSNLINFRGQPYIPAPESIT